MILHNIIFEFFLKLRILRALTCTLYLKNISFPGEMSSYFMSGQISPDYTEKIAHFRWKCPVLRCSEQLPDYITELHRFLGKCPRVLCSQHLLQIIPINYLILCKNVHDFYVRTISSDYTWKLSHFKQKCLHLFCRLHFSSVYLKYCIFLRKM